MMIQTDRLLLRRMTAEDTEDLLEIFADPRVMESFGSGPFDRGQMENWVRRNLKHQEEYGYGLFSVILTLEDRLIGDCGLEHMEISDQPEVELGYDFRSDYWRQGYATEAAIAVRDFAWYQLGLSRLISLIRPSNIASCRVAQKIGMTKEQEIVRGDQIYCIYALSRREA